MPSKPSRPSPRLAHPTDANDKLRSGSATVIEPLARLGSQGTSMDLDYEKKHCSLTWRRISCWVRPPCHRLLALGHGRPDRALVCVGDKDPFVEAESLAELTNGWKLLTGGLSVHHYAVPNVMSPAMTHDIGQWISTSPETAGTSLAARSDQK